MTYFAKLDNTLTVVTVVAGSASDDGKELDISNRTDGTYRQTYPDASKRKNYAGIGFTYDRDKDAFIPPKPYASWTLDTSTCKWKAPAALPSDSDSKDYYWDQANTKWSAD